MNRTLSACAWISCAALSSSARSVVKSTRRTIGPPIVNRPIWCSGGIGLDESGHGLPERVDRLPTTDAAPVVDQQRDLHRLGPDLGRHDLRGAPFLGDPKLLRPEIGHRSPVFIGDRHVDAAELLGAHRSHPGDTREGHHNESCHQRCEAVLHCRSSLVGPDAEHGPRSGTRRRAGGAVRAVTVREHSTLGDEEGGQEFTSADEEALVLFAAQAATAARQRATRTSGAPWAACWAPGEVRSADRRGLRELPARRPERLIR